MNRIVILIVVLVLLGGVSAYMWSSSEGTETDTKVAQQTEKYTCPKCGGDFELTLAESTEMYKSGAGITCPKCKETGATKTDVQVMMGGFGGSEETTEEPPATEDTPKNAVGGMKSLKN